MSDLVTRSGVVRDVFAHRFVLNSDDGVVLADVGPAGLEQIELRPGSRVVVEGEQKPSELKVRTFQAEGEAKVHIGPRPHDGDDADPAAAVAAARAAGYLVEGEPRRKPKHFEITAHKDGRPFELHVRFDGDIHKAKPIAADA